MRHADKTAKIYGKHGFSVKECEKNYFFTFKTLNVTIQGGLQ